MWIKSGRLGSWSRRRKLGLEFRKHFLDCSPRGFIEFGAQHAPVTLDIEAGDLDLVHSEDLDARCDDKSVGCPTLGLQLLVKSRHTSVLVAC